MPADALATLGASASAGLLLTPKASIRRVKGHMLYHYTKQSLIQLMACRLLSSQPLYEPMMVYL